MKVTAGDLDALTAVILESAKYRHVSTDVIRQIGEQELRSRSSIRDAIKETKSRLHQAAGAYLDRAPNYDRWKAGLALAEDEHAIRELSRSWMQSHSSTRERLPILDEFYRATLQSPGSIHSVIDIACGLNPLAIPWMGLAEGFRYDAFDLYEDMAGFLGSYLNALGVIGSARAADCVGAPPETAADLAIILKFLPVLEQQAKGSTLEWLKRINAPNLLVSFPTRSLSGKGKGMARHYEARFLDTISRENWTVSKFEFDGELCFYVKR